MNKARTCSVWIGDEEWTAHFHYSPGRPGCHTQRNGDPGWPADPPEIEVDCVKHADGTVFMFEQMPERDRDMIEQACLDAAIQQDEDEMIGWYESRERRCE
jgi:hypothetical protein